MNNIQRIDFWTEIKTMKRTTINNSSSVTEIGYDASKKEMTVSFHKTGDYRYSNVSQAEYDAIMLTYQLGGSIGSAVAKTVKGKECVNMRKESMK